MSDASDPRPPSAVSAGTGLAGLAGLFAWIVAARAYGMTGPFAALAALFACGAPMVGWSLLVDRVRHMVLPVCVLTLTGLAGILRHVRSSVGEALRQDYIRTARSKGLSRRVVLFRHVLRNALLSTVTLVGLQVGALLGGAVITESVFAVPGVGRLMVDSIFARDYPVIQALTLVLAVIVSLAFLVTDLVQMWLDPRVAR